MRTRKPAAAGRSGWKRHSVGVSIVPHPALFLQALPPKDRRQALAELEAIRHSNAGTSFNCLTAWFRQTRFATVQAALEEHFRREVARRPEVGRC